MKNIGYLYYKEYFESLSFYKSSNEWKAKFSGKEAYDKIKNESIDANLANAYNFGNLPPLELTTVYPGLLIGSGYIHEIGGKNKIRNKPSVSDELKLGFYFDHTTGLPVIPGSSVKGAIRSVFPFHRKNLGEDFRKSRIAYINHLLKDEIKVIDKDLSEDEIKKLEMEIFESGKDIFLDAFPKNSLKHNGKFLSDDYITAHDKPLKDPNPVKFLKVLPEVVFEFNFILQKSEVVNGLTIDNKLILLKKILLDFAVGAKTNVGYGQFEDLNNNNSSNNVTSTGFNAQAKITKKKPEQIQETEEDKKIINGAKLQCKVIEKEDKYYTFQFEWGNKMTFKKKISKITDTLNIGDIIEITVSSDYKTSRSVAFQNKIKKL
jgi:CRISPR-associated protein Cmr6